MITLWLDAATLAFVGELLYFVALFASLAIAWRMWGIWRKWKVSLAFDLTVYSLLTAAYWLYVIVRIHLGCSAGDPIVGELACLELTFWSRLIVAIGTSFIAAWVWKMR
jgi:hypothetical protein